MDLAKKSQIRMKKKKKKFKPDTKLSLQSLPPTGVTEETNVSKGMLNETVQNDAMYDLDAICKEESDNRILICGAFVTFVLIFISTILTVVAYISKQSNCSPVIMPNVTKSDLMEGN